MKLIVRDPWMIKGHMVYSVNLKENNLPVLRKEINDLLLHKEVEIFDVKCEVIGIEMYLTPDTYKHTDIGVMIKPI